MSASITYTPQEMIMKRNMAAVGASFCMCRDYVLIWRHDYTRGAHIDDMNAFLGGA